MMERKAWLESMSHTRMLDRRGERQAFRALGPDYSEVGVAKKVQGNEMFVQLQAKVFHVEHFGLT
jgi:hypothetical protein